jgi:mannose-6-phosphate isomerase-like protein (cupin superfamily)
MWLPDRFFYKFNDVRVPGTEMWFELKTSPDDNTVRPMYNVRASGKEGTFVIVFVEPESQSISCFYTDGPNIVTIISGSGTLVVNGQPQELERGSSVTVEVNSQFQLRNHSDEPFIAEIRPDTPRMWNPTTSFWEISAERFVMGDEVWFEFVLPA